jgi:hypothetical protein
LDVADKDDVDPLTTGIINLQQAALSSKIDFAVAGKILRSQADDGSAALELVNAATSGFDKAGDALTAAATGLGSQIDTYA